MILTGTPMLARNILFLLKIISIIQFMFGPALSLYVDTTIYIRVKVQRFILWVCHLR